MKTLGYSRIALSISALALVLWGASRKGFFADTVSSPFLGVALLSVFLILLRTRIHWKELAGVAALFLAMAWLDLRFLGYPAHWPVWVSFLGISALGVLALRAIWSQGAARRVALLTVGPAFFFVASEWVASYFLEWTEKAHPKVLDLYLYSFDASLKVQLPFVLGQLFRRFPTFHLLSVLFYMGLPVAIGLTYAGCLMRDKRNALPSFLAFLMTGPVGAVFYNIFPALGPMHIFRMDFPWHPLTYEQASRLFLESVAVPGARNAMPSLHAAWIFLVFWYARNLSLVERAGAALFVFFTLCATMGTGEHYFIDLIVAVPFSLFVVTLGELTTAGPRKNFVLPLLTGLGTTLAWFAMLRFGTKLFWFSAVIPWTACIGTLLACGIAGKMLLGERPRVTEAREEKVSGVEIGSCEA